MGVSEDRSVNDRGSDESNQACGQYLVALFVDVEVLVLAGAEDMGMDMPDMNIEIAMPVAEALDAVYEAVSELPVDVPPMGTVDWPLISAQKDEWYVPLIPAKLIKRRRCEST